MALFHRISRLLRAARNTPSVSSALPSHRPALAPGQKAATESPCHEKVPATHEGLIDVRELIARYDVGQHAARADQYFRDFSLDDARFHKPFMSFETPELLTKLGVVLHNLRYSPGLRVLDFGCGTGWLTRSLAKMGCLAIGVDVSQTALALARQYTEMKYPEISKMVRYLPFDGVTLDLEPGSVDRVICFDSFHHVPNQQQILTEFHRVLAPDGIAVFCEPGPCHSLDPMSQHEMRTFDVIENDIVIEEIWKLARELGFRDLKLSLFSIQPTLCSIEEFSTLQSFGKGRAALERFYTTSLKPVYDGLRFFVLEKDPPIRDSRNRDGLSCRIEATAVTSGDDVHINGLIYNLGSAVWLPSGESPGSVNIGLIRQIDENRREQDFRRVFFLGARLNPGEHASFSIHLTTADIGGAQLYADLVAEHVAWFGTRSAPPVRLV